MAKIKIPWGVGMCLLDGPLSLPELKTSILTAPFDSTLQPGRGKMPARHRRLLQNLDGNLADLMNIGWVVQQDDLYALTPLGRDEIGKITLDARSKIETASQAFQSLMQPATASKVTLIIQIMLAVIKLPAGILSGSVGLLNDSFDTILDLFSSLLVYLGIRFNRERLASIVLVIFMLLTGGLTLYEAIHRLFVPFVPNVDLFPFAAAVLSALSGLILWTYLRYVGLKYNLMAFIAESVDARNHIIVSLGVTAGLVASLLHFGWLDMLVGLAVAILILWSAIGLVSELLHSSAEKPVDLSHYGLWLQSVYQNRREHYLRNLMLSLVKNGEAKTREELVLKIRKATDLRENSPLKSVGLNRRLLEDEVIEYNLNELISHEWLVDGETIALSTKGKEYLAREMQRHRRLSQFVK
jgi:Co/Zn/Cd efflux system component